MLAHTVSSEAAATTPFTIQVASSGVFGSGNLSWAICNFQAPFAVLYSYCQTSADELTPQATKAAPAEICWSFPGVTCCHGGFFAPAPRYFQTSPAALIPHTATESGDAERYTSFPLTLLN